MRVVPSRAPMPREEYLEKRKEQHEATVAYYRAHPNAGGFAHVVMPLPEGVFCDECDVPVEGAEVYLVEYGARAVCRGCYAQEEGPVAYRELLPDGSLGDELTPQ